MQRRCKVNAKEPGDNGARLLVYATPELARRLDDVFGGRTLLPLDQIELDSLSFG